MSGIAAVYDRDRSVSSDAFDSVFESLSHRGWDGADAVVDDRVALGHQHAYTTPESVGERQPRSLGDLRITFDGRIDNRPELFEALAGADERPPDGTTDAELALRAYRAFGEAFLQDVVGAFALAISDPDRDRLLLARDKTGIRKLYYAESGGTVVAASEMQAVLAHPAVSTAIDEGFLGETIAGEFLTAEETFYTDVRRVPPGSFRSITAEGSRQESYWEAWNADVEYDRTTDLAEQFYDRLETAVACRLRAPELPGVMMSGGLDSTSVTCVADRYLRETDDFDGNLHAYSLVIDGSAAFEDELDRIDAVVEACDLELHSVRANDHYALKDVELYERAARESPVFSPVVQPSKELFERSAGAGRHVMLSGAAGNVYDGTRLYYYDLLRRGKLRQFVRDARADELPLSTLLTWYVLAPSSDRIGEFLIERYRGGYEEIPPWLDESFVERSGLADRLSEPIETGIDAVSQELLYKRYQRSERPFEDAIKRRFSLRHGVEFRYPYLDSRLLSFMLALPPGKLFEAGQDKALFRRAMKGVLPEIVRTQDASVTFNRIVDIGILEERREYVEDLLTDSKLVETGITDASYTDFVLENLDDDEVGKRRIWDLLAMELWLRQWA